MSALTNFIPLCLNLNHYFLQVLQVAAKWLQTIYVINFLYAKVKCGMSSV